LEDYSRITGRFLEKLILVQSVLDVRWGCNNVRMKEGDEWKTVFRTNCRLFKPLVMFFRPTNSPSTFQTIINDISQDLIMEGIICIYLDESPDWYSNDFENTNSSYAMTSANLNKPPLNTSV
jgi:hypothetical protein